MEPRGHGARRTGCSARAFRQHQGGFGMIEVLIAVLILAIGLLGMASLQTTGMQMVTGSLSRSQAVALASDLIERVRANPNNVAAYALPESDAPACDTDYAIPNSGVVAVDDLAEWRNSLGCLLPEARSSIRVQGRFVTVEVSWAVRTNDLDDDRVRIEAEI